MRTRNSQQGHSNDATTHKAVNMTDQNQHATSLFRMLARGFMRRCPCCGEGRLFYAYLKPVDQCAHCATAFGHIRADDIPAYFTILIVGHLVVPSAVMLEQTYHPSELFHLSIWIPLTLALTFSLLPLIKGSMVSLMWRLRISGNETQ